MLIINIMSNNNLDISNIIFKNIKNKLILNCDFINGYILSATVFNLQNHKTLCDVKQKYVTC
jgi:hypothetical protein